MVVLCHAHTFRGGAAEIFEKIKEIMDKLGVIELILYLEFWIVTVVFRNLSIISFSFLNFIFLCWFHLDQHSLGFIKYYGRLGRLAFGI